MGRQRYEFRGPKRKERPRKDWLLHVRLHMHVSADMQKPRRQISLVQWQREDRTPKSRGRPAVGLPPGAAFVGGSLRAPRIWRHASPQSRG